MLLILFILIEYLLCCTSYWLYKTDSLLTFIVFLSPFYLPFISFLFFSFKKQVVMPGKYKGAIITGMTFFFMLLLMLLVPLQQFLPGFLSKDEYSIIISVAASFVPIFIINKQYSIYGILFLVLPFIAAYLFSRYRLYDFILVLGGNASMKGDTLLLTYFFATFIFSTACMVFFHLKKGKMPQKTG